MTRVLMFGPSKSMKGGVSSVVNSYFYAGLDKSVNLNYIATINDNKIFSLFLFIFSCVSLLIKMRSYNIIHLHMASRGSFYRKSILLILGKLLNKKVIIHVHGAKFMHFYNVECNNILKNYVRYIFDNADLIIALSSEWKDNISLITNQNKIVIVNNGVGLPEVNTHKNYNKKNILFLGRIGHRKGIYDLIDVAPSIIEKHPDVQFFIGGDGEMELAKKKCKQKKIEKNFTFVGWVNGEKKVELLNEATLYVLPSYNEGMPISILEAMAYSLPIISTTVGGICEMVSNGVNGQLIEPGNKVDLEFYLLKYIDSSLQREKEGIASRSKVEKDFNINRISEKLVEIYLKLA